MKKAIILGSPGSGKSYFARQLKELTGLTLINQDNIWWKPDRTHISREEFDAALSTILSKDEWILDGDYSRTYEVRMRACDTVFFLDYSMEECMSGIVLRVGQERPDIPWTENTIDPELVKMVCRYKEENRPVIMELLSRFPEKEVHIFSNREETETWLRNAVSGYHQIFSMKRRRENEKTNHYDCFIRCLPDHSRHGVCL